MLFQPAADIFKHFLMVRFHQQFMPGTGVQLALNVLHTGVFQALDGTLHALALFAHWVAVKALDDKGRQRLAFVRRGSPGLRIVGVWSGFGQRTTASGTVSQITAV